MANLSAENIAIKKVSEAVVIDDADMLAAEEPLEMRLVYGPAHERKQQSISVTMRTPGNDFELAVGFLFTEGIVKQASEIVSIEHCNQPHDNIVKIILNDQASPDIQKLERNFYTTSSCGICGKSSIDAVRSVCNYPVSADNIRIPFGIIYALPDLLRKEQSLFEHTGGIHASALFDINGRLLLMREDVGRHNALDKVIGAGLNEGLLPFDDHILLLSGRASFELIQKAMMAGIKVVAAIGAPSTLAASMAKENNMTLIGFLRGKRFNIYSGAQRIIIQ